MLHSAALTSEDTTQQFEDAAQSDEICNAVAASLDEDLNLSTELQRCNSFDFVIEEANALKTVAHSTISDHGLPQPVPSLQQGPLRSTQVVVNPINRKSHYGWMCPDTEDMEEIELDDLFGNSSLEERAHKDTASGSTPTIALPDRAVHSLDTVSQADPYAVSYYPHQDFEGLRHYNSMDIEAARRGDSDQQRRSTTVPWFVRKIVAFFAGLFVGGGHQEADIP